MLELQTTGPPGAQFYICDTIPEKLIYLTPGPNSALVVS